MRAHPDEVALPRSSGRKLTESILFYDTKDLGLGDRLLAEVKIATARVECYQEIAQVIDLVSEPKC